MTKHQRFIKEIADAVVQLFSKGTLDPSAQEIADAYYGREVLSLGAVEDVWNCLERVCARLRGESHLHVHLTSDYYYKKWRGEIPADETEVRRCLAGGAGAKATGIRKAQPDDPIYRTWLERVVSNGGKALGKRMDRTVDAAGKGFVSMGEAAQLLISGHSLAQPSKTKLAARILKALPEEASKVGT